MKPYSQETNQTYTKPPSCTAAFSGGISIKPQTVAQNNRNWSHVQPSKPVQSGFIQNQFNQNPYNQSPYNQQYSQPTYQYEPSSYAVNQYQPQQVISKIIRVFNHLRIDFSLEKQNNPRNQM